MNILNSVTHSPLPSIGGILTAVGGAIVGAQATGLVGKPPEWLLWIGIILVALGPAILGTTARQHNVSSQDAGIRPEPKKDGSDPG